MTDVLISDDVFHSCIITWHEAFSTAHLSFITLYRNISRSLNSDSEVEMLQWVYSVWISGYGVQNTQIFSVKVKNVCLD